MAQYRKKPVVIEAMKWDGQNVDEVGRFISDFSGITAFIKGNEIKIPTLEGEMTARQGDWIIKGINGEFYPCKPDIFEKTYEKVEA